MHRQGLNSNESLPDELLIHEQTPLKIFGLLLNSKSCKTVRVKVEEMKQRSLAVGPNSSHISRTLQATQIRAAGTSDRASHWAGRSCDPSKHPHTLATQSRVRKCEFSQWKNNTESTRTVSKVAHFPTTSSHLVQAQTHRALKPTRHMVRGMSQSPHTQGSCTKKKQWTQRDDMLCTRFTNPTSTFPSLVAHLLNCLLNESRRTDWGEISVSASF